MKNRTSQLRVHKMLQSSLRLLSIEHCHRQTRSINVLRQARARGSHPIIPRIEGTKMDQAEPKTSRCSAHCPPIFRFPRSIGSREHAALSCVSVNDYIPERRVDGLPRSIGGTPNERRRTWKRCDDCAARCRRACVLASGSMDQGNERWSNSEEAAAKERRAERQRGRETEEFYRCA